MRKVIQGLWKKSEGQGLPEYALLVGAVVVLALTLLLAFSPAVTRLITGVGDHMVMPDVPGAPAPPDAASGFPGEETPAARPGPGMTGDTPAEQAR